MTNLAPYASHDHTTLGRRYSEEAPNNRTEYQRDRDRIVHSAAFRRLEYKTQVFVNHEGDMFRTRLTHSLEVAQIGRSMARALRVNEELTEAIALAHDLGHTPFGHAGQDALNHAMKDHGGFEHNLQSLRIVEKLEERYATFNGLNLTFETREGILKHCSPSNARALAELGQRFIEKKQAGVEAQIANIADEIAYNNHDIDDGLRAGLLTIEQLCEVSLFAEQYQAVCRLYPDIEPRRAIHETIRRMINSQITDFLEYTQQSITQHQPQSREDVQNLAMPLVGYSEDMLKKTQELKRFLRNNLYKHYRVHRMTSKATRVIQSLFEAFMEDVCLLPPQAQAYTRQATEEKGHNGAARRIADYIAGMTDRYAIQEYEKIFNPVKLT